MAARTILLSRDPEGSPVRAWMYLTDPGSRRKCADGTCPPPRGRRRSRDATPVELDPGMFTVDGREVTILNAYPPGAEYSFSWGGLPPATTPPVADFTVSTASGEAPLSVTFTDASTGAPFTSHGWDFGDGVTGGSSRHTHTYAEPGTYTVTLTVSNAAGTDSDTKAGLITVTSAGDPDPGDPQPDAWDPATMLGGDLLHPNDAGMTYLADCYEWALADAGKTPAAGTLLTAYGDSWTASDTHNTPALRAIHQLRDRLGLTLTNQAVNGYKAGDCAARAIGTAGTFSPGSAGLVVVAAGLNDLQLADTAQQRAATGNYLRALFAVACAAERIEQTAFTFAGTWSSTANPNGTFSGGSNALTTTEGASATYTIATPGTYYLLTQGTDGSSSWRSGVLTITQGTTTLATLDLDAQATATGLTLSNFGPLAVRLDNVQAGTLTITYSKNGRASTVYGFLDALVRISSTPPTILCVKPVHVLASSHNSRPALLDYIRDLYDTMAAEFGTTVVVCDPDPSWTP